ncbi:hypothetical protein [Photorhabdus caribbeanensis]|uniref:hypothetical protein n=1 Tax=Photorhabdus caribbeanensis TaxID=1004165 RepID=UPI001BD320A2|nr:hypothetical protein [Photorhabdus caribbeanensis]MBS9422905.1 hypothetical protein [Photorhabdus caribbeanensis]
MSENSKAIPEGESKKIGDVNLKGIIDGIEIHCNVDLTYQTPKKPEQETSQSLPRRLQTKHYFSYFVLPLIIIATCFTIDIFLIITSTFFIYFTTRLWLHFV